MLVLFSLLIALVLIILYGFFNTFHFRKKHYKVYTKKQVSPVRIVFIADLHGVTYGKRNTKLINAIKKSSPDIICIAGDLVVKNSKKNDVAIDFLRRINKVCPVYYSAGNHEVRLEDYNEYLSDVIDTKTVYLSNISALHKDINIFGLDLPHDEYYHKVWKKVTLSHEYLKDLMGDNKDNTFNIMLAHNPEYFDTYSLTDTDLVLSGHVHGGIARLPILGGVLSPSLRLFPKYDFGEFVQNDTTMILSKGLGLHHIRLRFFMSSELSIIDIVTKEK